MAHRSDPNNTGRPGSSVPASSTLARLLRLGSLVGRVGASVAVVQRQLDAELPGWRNTIAQIEPAAIAAASIGQVHRGVLVDVRPVAVKIQYPGIDSIIETPSTCGACCSRCLRYSPMPTSHPSGKRCATACARSWTT